MAKEDFKKELKEILELVKVCPRELQEKCFEILLTHALSRRSAAHVKERVQEGERPTLPRQELELPTQIERRMKAFAAQHGLSLDEITKVYSVDELGNVNIEVTDLKASKTAQRQRNLALLVGGRHQFMEGSFDVPLEELRELCVTYSAYDAANFMKNLKSSRELFAGFKPNATNKLSPKGKSELGSLIKALAS